MNDVSASHHASITKPASKTMFGSMLSLAGGLISNVVIAAIFGARADMDAYLTAMVIPTYLEMVFYSSLAFVLVPAFIEAENKREEDQAWSLVGTFFWLTVIVLLGASIIGAVFSRQIISTTAPGFQYEKAELAAQMLSVLMFSTPLLGLFVLSVGIQNARQRFFWPSVSPAFGALGNLATLLILYPVIGSMALPWGFLVSIAIQTAITTIPLIAHGWKQTAALGSPEVKRVLKLMVPLIIFGVIYCSAPVADRYFSSVLPDGQVAYMGYASKISNVFVALLARGIAASIFPVMARAHSQGGIEALAEKSSFGLRLSFAVALPGVLISAAIAIPLIGLLFERGSFRHADTLGVALILLPILINDVFLRMVGNIFERSFYVLKDTTTQPIIVTILLLLYIAVAGFFVRQWGYVGLVWAGVLKKTAATLIIGILLSLRFPSKLKADLVSSLLKYAFAAVAAYAGGHIIIQFASSVPVLFQVLAGGITGFAIYLLILFVLDREILISVYEFSGARFFLEKVHIARNWFPQGRH
jgi:putative peptidoglycan lipid II flippase